MRTSALNLLRHPRQPWWGWREHLGWGLAGLALAWLGAACREAWRTDVLREHRHWTAQKAQQLTWQADQARAGEQRRRWAQQQAAWQVVQARQQSVLAVQAALQREAEQGLRLLRWQADGQTLWLHGQWLHSEDVSGLQARLGDTLGQPWALHSLGAQAAAPGVSWTLGAPWSAASAAQARP